MKHGLNNKQKEKLDSMVWDYGYKRAMVEVHLARIANTSPDTSEEKRYIRKEEASAQEDARQANSLKEQIIGYVHGIVKFYSESEEYYREQTALSEGQDLKGDVPFRGKVDIILE